MRAAAWLSLISLLFEASSKRIPSFAGPFILYAEYLQPCENGGADFVFNVRAARFSPYKPYEKQLVTGNITYRVLIDDKMTILMKVDVFRNNAWKENYLLLKFPRACTSLREQAPGVFSLLNGGKPSPKSGPCIIHAGAYDLNIPLDTRFPNFPVFPYGRYRVNFNFGPPEKPDTMCSILVANIIPRP